MRLVVRVAALVLPLLALSVPAGAQAVFPNQGTIGLVPPEGMSEIPNVPGFQDRATKASILVLEMPQPAFQEITSHFAPAELKKQNVTVEERRDVELADGVKAVLLKGYQSIPNAGTTLKKWILIAGGKQQTGMITVQFPEEASARYPDKAVEAALKTVVFRAPPSNEELMARLPFTFDDMEGFKVFKVLGGSAVLLTKGDAEPDPSTQPFFIVAAGPGEVREEERESVAKRAISSVPGVKELRVERGGPLRIGGQPGYELIANALDAKSGKPVKVAQWLRFGRTANLRMVGVAPAASFDADFGAMRGLRDGIELR
ncbi:conserved hypothetical protein [Ancylobacter novellus DSM 506]|uniref:Uncharacterized protein n=1 Tax=Ancylobacter novellus (strain ATCC 8093 / DSM 506 / JCM 20403 / CCM 1077 / IAM 12100 / NBRC 12443 / NCIMB 10456) TaxID=639283 RepID=D6ZYY6_ANCN5|nr:hypothetical protein [Ancylobacter novellus]ADH91105.1 conserved hypothetical protein [Ancylobacter novellus DSM 506]